MGVESYPKRPGHFAHKFCRVLAKACVANDLGADACWLLTVIAHTEDAGGYRKAVSFHNGQLASFCGFGSVDKLERVRRKAVEAGLLHHIPGARGKAARYWVILPDQFRWMDDLPSDERPEKFSGEPAEPETQYRKGAAESAVNVRTETTRVTQPESQYPTVAAETAVNPRSIRGQSAAESAVNVRTLSSLNQNLNLEPEPRPPLSPPQPDVVELDNPEVGPTPSEVMNLWNAQPGLTPAVAGDVNRDRMIRAWATGNPLWVRHWRAVIEFMGREPFYRGENRERWRVNLGWLFDRSNYSNTVEKMRAPPVEAKAVPPTDKRSASIKAAVDAARAKAKEGQSSCPASGSSSGSSTT